MRTLQSKGPATAQLMREPSVTGRRSEAFVQNHRLYKLFDLHKKPTELLRLLCNASLAKQRRQHPAQSGRDKTNVTRPTSPTRTPSSTSRRGASGISPSSYSIRNAIERPRWGAGARCLDHRGQFRQLDGAPRIRRTPPTTNKYSARSVPRAARHSRGCHFCFA